MSRSLSILKNNELLLILGIALIVRLISINQSLWLDEGTTAKVVQQYSLIRIVTEYAPLDFHPPLFYIIEKLWTSVFGYSEIALRFPSVLFSLITGVFVYLLGKKLKDVDTGIWASVFFLFNPLVLYYSQEARMYSMAVCFLSAALYFFILFLKKPTQENTVLFNLFIFLSFITFYGSVFFIAAMYIVALLKKKNVLLLLPGLIGALLLLLPLLYQQFVTSRASLSSVVHWGSTLGTVTIKNLLLFPMKFSIGRISFEPKILYYVISFIWTATVFLLALKGFLKHKVLLYLFVVPIILGVIFSIFSPLLQYFRFLYLIVPLSLALAVGVQKETHKTALVVIFFIFSSLYLATPQFHREDWKTMAPSLYSREVYSIPSSMDALRYYNKEVKIMDIRESTSANEVTVIPYTFEIYGIDHKNLLSQRGYSYVGQSDYRGVWYERWRRF